MKKTTRFGLIFTILFTLLPGSAYSVPAEGQRVMISGPSPAGVEIGKDIARQGGNAVDVAVAVALSLAVTHPYYAAFGGGGFALVKIGKSVDVIDFREVAPKKSSPELYKDKDKKASRNGGLAVGVPGIPAGLWELHKKHGKLKWTQLFEGPIRLAEKGFEVSGEWVSLTARNKERFNSEAVKILFQKNGAPLRPGTNLKQPQLAKLLKLLRAKGASAFYTGAVALDIVQTVNTHGGIFSQEDLKEYKARWLAPLVTEFAGHRLYLMPPPSSGGIIIAQALRLIELQNLNQKDPLSVDELHLLAEIMKLSYRGRSLLGDPEFAQNPLDKLRSDQYLKPLSKKISLKKALDVERLKDIHLESENTTHFSVMDDQGGAVAMTVTLNGDYGSGLVSPKYGVALNNEMDDFTTRPGEPNMFGLIQGEGNLVRPGARPLSSMSPTLVEKNGQIVLALGAPGGPRIISGVLQVLYRVLTQKFDIDQAIQAPRVHHQFLPNTVFTDALKLPPETLTALRSRGHAIEFGSTGKVYGVKRNADGILFGAFDSRGEGAAGGF